MEAEFVLGGVRLEVRRRSLIVRAIIPPCCLLPPSCRQAAGSSRNTGLCSPVSGIRQRKAASRRKHRRSARVLPYDTPVIAGKRWRRNDPRCSAHTRPRPSLSTTSEIPSKATSFIRNCPKRPERRKTQRLLPDRQCEHDRTGNKEREPPQSADDKPARADHGDRIKQQRRRNFDHAEHVGCAGLAEAPDTSRRARVCRRSSGLSASISTWVNFMPPIRRSGAITPISAIARPIRCKANAIPDCPRISVR